MCAQSLSCVQLCHNPMACSPQGSPLSMGFFRQEYWNRLPFLPPGDLPDPGIEPASPALAGGFFTTSATWETLTACLTMVLLEGPWIQNIRTNFLNYGISVGQHCGGQQFKICYQFTQSIFSLARQASHHPFLIKKKKIMFLSVIWELGLQ